LVAGSNPARPTKNQRLSITLLQNGVSQHEISRKTGVDRKTIRKTIRKIAQATAADTLTDPPKSPTPATGGGF